MKKFIFSNFKNNLSLIIGLGFFSILSSGFSLIMPYFNGKFLDVLLKNPDYKIIYKFATILLFFGIVSCLNNYFYGVAITKVKNTIIFQCIYDVMVHLRKVPISYLAKYNPAYLNNRITNDVASIFEFFIENYANIFANTVSILLMIVFLFRVDHKLIFLLIIFVPLYIILFVLMKNPLFKVGIKFKEQRNIFYGDLNEQYSINEFIKMNANFNFWNKYLSTLIKKYIIDLVKYNKILLVFSSYDSLLSLLYTISILILGGSSIINGSMSIGQFTIINTYLNMIQKNIRYFLNLGKGYQDALAAYIRIKELLDVKEEINGNTILEKITNIKVYDLTHPFLKKKANYLFENNKIYGLVGENGVGKTTLLKIMTGVLDNSEAGYIEYDGINIKKLNMYEIRNKRIAMLPQNIYFYNLHVQEILSCYSEDIIRDIKYVLNYYNIYSLYVTDYFDIFKLLNRRICDFSGGEKQKILFLCVLLKKADLYIFDEPSAGIDSITVSAMRSCLCKLRNHGTIIIVTHDKSLYSICDNIYKI